jgi:hypothetical protein
LRVFVKDNQAIVGESYGDLDHVHCRCGGIDAQGLFYVPELIGLGWVELPIVLPVVSDKRAETPLYSPSDLIV